MPRTTALLLIVLTACVPALFADEGPPAEAAEPESRADEVARLTREAAEEYEFSLATSSETRLELRPEPVLRWTNPVIGEIYGNVFIWTADGRPEVAASLFKWYSPNHHTTHEFQSLSPHALTATRDGREVWRCPQGGIEWKPVPGAERPAETAARRLRQMRQMARQFSAELTLRGERRELRLLTQPLYRYESTRPDLLDGSLWAFVEATAPEVLLLLEAHQTADGAQWYFAPARMHWSELRVRYDGQEVWNAPIAPPRDVNSGRGHYTKFQFREELP
jgi:hypothetical protein